MSRPQAIAKVAQGRAQSVVRELRFHELVRSPPFGDQEVHLSTLLVSHVPEGEVTVSPIVPGVDRFQQVKGHDVLEPRLDCRCR